MEEYILRQRVRHMATGGIQRAGKGEPEGSGPATHAAWHWMDAKKIAIEKEEVGATTGIWRERAQATVIIRGRQAEGLVDGK